MSRAIDKLPEVDPKSRRKLKVVVMSASRSGTLGLYKALKILGYRCYHVVEALERGPAHQRVAAEAITSSRNRLGGHKRYTRADFDKWLGEYDCVVEFPGCMMEDYLDAYLSDPDVKFILTEREPDTWVRSMNNTIGEFITAFTSPPMSWFRKINERMDAAANMGSLMYLRFSEGAKPGQAHASETLKRNYVEYIKDVKSRIPADRLKVIKLEEGLDWKHFCPFLGHEIPKQPYPSRNTPDEFKDIVVNYMNPEVIKTITTIGLTVLPVIGAGVWFAYGNGMSWLRRP